MAQQIVAAGESLVVEFVDGANLYEHIAAETISDWLLAVGFEDAQYRDDTVTSLIENGYDMPMAWSAPVRSELLEINVGAGYIAGVTAQFQRAMAQHCGLAFVRVMQGSVGPMPKLQLYPIFKGQSISESRITESRQL